MQSKYHHLIPQTYLSAWGNSSGTLKIEWLENGKIENRNTDSVAGINHYHSIIAGMPFCTKDDTDHFSLAFAITALHMMGKFYQTLLR